MTEQEQTTQEITMTTTTNPAPSVNGQPQAGHRTLYSRHGTAIYLQKEENASFVDAIPAGTYMVKQLPPPMGGALYLDRMDDFQLPTRLYGGIADKADRVLRTFLDRPATTGVLMAGEKGGGKTLLAKLICSAARRKGMPTIVINSPWAGEAFNQFVQAIDQPAVFLFDEFEKIYPMAGRMYDADGDPLADTNKVTQDKVLTLLDGTISTKKLFLFTANDKWKVSRHMLNRPGRLYYMFEFYGMDADSVADYCADRLKDKSHAPQIQRLCRIFESFSFDMLAALVEEMNRYGESPADALAYLNIKPDRGTNATFVVKLTKGNRQLSLYHKRVSGCPLTSAFEIVYYATKRDEREQDESRFEITPDQLVSMSGETGEFVYTVDGFTVRLTEERKIRSARDFREFMAVGYD